MYLSKRSNGNYYIFYQNIFGKKTCISTKCKLKQEALKFLSNFEVELKFRQQTKTIPITLKEFKNNYLKYSESIHREKTTGGFKNTFKFLIDYLGDIQLSEITQKRMNDYLQNRIETSSIYQARKDLINISSAFTKAVQDKYMLENACKGIKRFRIPERQPLFYSELDFEILLKVIDIDDLKDLIIFAANTGLRQMELLTLNWNQINFKDRFIILDNRSHLTKSNKIRTIPLNLTALQILTKRELSKASEFVFTYNDEPIKKSYLQFKFRKYILASKLNPKFNFHSLRHSFASWLVQKGVSIYEVSKLLGHSDLKVTEIYAHLRPENLRNAVDLLN
jgi:integrase